MIDAPTFDAVTLDAAWVGPLLLALSVLVAFNLFLSLRMARLINTLAFARLPDTVPIGAPLPAFHARPLAGGRKRDADALLGDQAAVLVFLSPGCKSCLQRHAELRRMLPLMEEAGVALWVIAHGPPRRLRDYFDAAGLLPRALRVSERDLRRLNPKYSAPFYIFVGADRVVQASSLIGDDDWLSFRAQIGDVDPAES